MALISEQFQSLIQQMPRSERSSPEGIDLGQRIIQAVVSDYFEEELRAMDEPTSDLMSRMLSILCQRINEEAASLEADAAEEREEREALQAQLDILRERMRTAEEENLELRAELQEVLAEAQQREAEYESELEQSKRDLESSKQAMQQMLERQLELEQLLKGYEIKIHEGEQQKLFLQSGFAREEQRRRTLEVQLREVQRNLVQLSWQFQSLQRSHDEISQSLQSKDERIRRLNRIIEESEYLSSLSPHSHRNDLPQDTSFNSQQLKRTLIEEQIPLIRLSQSQLPAEKSLQSISMISGQETPQLLQVPKSERILASESRPKKHPKVLLSHQKKPSKEDLSLRKDPEKPKSSRQDSSKGQDSKIIALSKQDSRAVKSKLTSIFRDRLQYKSENDEKHELRVRQLRDRLRQREEEISNLNRQVSLLKVLRTEPVVVSGKESRDEKRQLQQLRTENQALRRISKEITVRKQHLQYELQEYRERCNYYKSEHRKIYEQYLLKSAESAAYSQQLSQIEMSLREQEKMEVVELPERERQERDEEELLLQMREGSDEKDQFEDLSSKFNNLVLRHKHDGVNELQQPSFKSGEQPRDFYSVQNIHLTDISVAERTLEPERKLPKVESLEHSPAKAVLDEPSPLDQLILEGIEEITPRENLNQEIQTERLILSQLMQTSRKQNSFTDFQLIFSQHPPKLQLSSLGCLAQIQGREKTMMLASILSLGIAPTPTCLSLISSHSISILPKQKQSTSIGNHIQLQHQSVQAQTPILVDQSCGESIKTNHFSCMFAPILQEASISTNKPKIQSTFTNTDIVATNEIGIENQLQKTEENSTNTCIETLEIQTNTHRFETLEASMNTDEVCRESLEIQTNISTQIDAQIGTNKIELIDQEASTNKIDLIDQEVSTQICQLSQAEAQTLVKGMSFDRFDIMHCVIRKSKLRMVEQICISINRASKIDCATSPNPTQTKSKFTNTQIKHFKDAQTNHQSPSLQFSQPPTNLTIYPTICQPTLSLCSQTVKLGFSKGNRLQLDLSFLSRSIASASDSQPAICDDDEEEIVSQKRLGGFKSFTMRAAQISSCRTRSSSQDLQSNRSTKEEKISEKPLPLRQIIKQSMISEHSSSSEHKIEPQAIIISNKAITDPTASQTPFTNKECSYLATSRLVAEQEPVPVPQDSEEMQQPFSKDEFKIIKDYFYRLQKFELIHTVEATERVCLPTYDIENNMYVFQAKKRGGRAERFACERGKVIHFGTRTEFMELTARAPIHQQLKGNCLSLGNCEFRVFENKLEVNRALKRRCFKGEMENGQWIIQRAWVFRTS